MSIFRDLEPSAQQPGGVCELERPVSNAPSPDQSERRSTQRLLSAFRPGCVVIDGRITLGMIRNMSRSGVMIELDTPLTPGQRVSYFWDESNLVNAIVAWSDGKRHGLDNDAEARIFSRDHTFRSVRIPCAVEADAWVNGNLQRVEVGNLSLGGMRVRGLRAAAGMRVTIKIANLELYDADIRWIEGDEAGIRFAERMTRAQIGAILSHESIRFDRLVFD